jgi:hypothetical protein
MTKVEGLRAIKKSVAGQRRDLILFKREHVLWVEELLRDGLLGSDLSGAPSAAW